MCNCGLAENEKVKELEEFIDSREDKKASLIAILHKAQNLFGYIPQEIQSFIAKKLSIPVSKVYGVVSFYSYFTTTPKGKNVVNVCLGTACFVRGGGDILEEFSRKLGISPEETSEDGKYTLTSLRCVGACGLAPVVMINDKVYGNVTKKDVEKILEEYEV